MYNSAMELNIFSCTDQEMADSVLETAEVLEELSSELVDTAQKIDGLSSKEKGTSSHEILVEKAELLRREWASKVNIYVLGISAIQFSL